MWQAGRHRETAERCEAVLRHDPNSLDALHLLGLARWRLTGPEAGLPLLRLAHDLRPDFAPVNASLADLLTALNRVEDALDLLRDALAATPQRADLWCRQGLLQRQQQHEQAALASFDRSLALAPREPVLHYNRANTLRALGRTAESAAAYRQALALDPDYRDALNNLGNLLLAARKPPEALACYDRALARCPEDAMLLDHRSKALMVARQPEAAVEALERLLHGHPGHPHAHGALLMQRLAVCDWREDLDREIGRLRRDLLDGKPVCRPFELLALLDEGHTQLLCARRYASEYLPLPPVVRKPRPTDRNRIHVAYLSADFHNHATLFLMAGLLENHDRDRFEISAISFGPVPAGGMRDRLARGVERMVEAGHLEDRAVAELLAELKVDIAVDLKGYTADCRPGILARRPAPVQINFLGYPGSLGAGFMDYIVADRQLIPPGSEGFYDERVIRLPHSYQPNDRHRAIAPDTPSRPELGLPATGFVFCCFNNPYKLTPRLFAVWMRLLKQVPGSVLWLLAGPETARDRLRRAAQGHGVSPERLVFAPFRELPEHLARQRQADLFLDTLPVNAHTTASDALWAGLPVVTCRGESFAARVASSLLHAAGLPELVTEDLEAYEALALRLATRPGELRAIRDRLAGNRLTCPLFDTEGFRRDLEQAYQQVFQRHRRGEPPSLLELQPAGEAGLSGP